MRICFSAIHTSVLVGYYVICQVAIAMFGYMTEIDTVQMNDSQQIEADGKFLSYFVFNFMITF